MAGLTWPMWLVKLGYLVDNPWSMGLDRARKAGLILAEALCNNVQNNRPVTLVGFSLGAKAIFHCLVELAERGKYGLVEDVYLFGAPIMIPRVLPPAQQTQPVHSDATSSGTSSFKTGGTTPSFNYTSPKHLASLDEWRKAISVVGGTLTNSFTRVDWILGYLFRGSVAGMWEVAGMTPIVLDEEETPDVEVLHADDYEPSDDPLDVGDGVAYKTLSEEDRERKLREQPRTVRNVDVTELVPGHLYYRDAMPTLIKRVCGFACWTESVEVIEEIVVGDWMNEVDGMI
jgi:hypothetical protein